jgi:hypothetical protein
VRGSYQIVRIYIFGAPFICVVLALGFLSRSSLISGTAAALVVYFGALCVTFGMRTVGFLTQGIPARNIPRDFALLVGVPRVNRIPDQIVKDLPLVIALMRSGRATEVADVLLEGPLLSPENYAVTAALAIDLSSVFVHMADRTQKGTRSDAVLARASMASKCLPVGLRGASVGHWLALIRRETVTYNFSGSSQIQPSELVVLLAICAGAMTDDERLLVRDFSWVAARFKMGQHPPNWLSSFGGIRSRLDHD